LGETFSGYYSDGGQAYLEQVSHHPQISYLLYYGPQNAYKVWGPSNFAAHAGLNSLKVSDSEDFESLIFIYLDYN